MNCFLILICAGALIVFNHTLYLLPKKIKVLYFD